MFYGLAVDVDHRVLEYQSREDADRAARHLDGKDLRGHTVRVVADADVRPPYMTFTPLLIVYLAWPR